MMRETDTRVRPDVRERVGSGLAERIRSTSVSTDDVWRATWVRRGLLTRMTCTAGLNRPCTEFFGDAATHNESAGLGAHAAGRGGALKAAPPTGHVRGSWVPTGTCGLQRRSRAAAILPPFARPYRSTAVSPYVLQVGS